MKLTEYIRAGFSFGPGKLPTVAMPKPPTKATALPSFKTQVAKQASAVPRSDRRLANTDISNYRSSGDTRTVIRDFVASNPDLSATRASYLRVGIPQDYTIIARDLDGQINPDATKLAQEILRRITFLGDPTLGYNPVTDLQSLSESLAIEGLQYGGMALELVLDKMRAPTYLNAVSVTKIEWLEENDGVYPVQVTGGERRKLDIPTFFYVSIDQDLLSPYSTSYFESAIQAVLADTQFMNNLRGAIYRTLNPRLMATIVEDKIKASCPPEIVNDPEAYAAFCTNVVESINTMLSDLTPDDALASFDSVTYSVLGEKGSSNITDALSTMQKLVESKVAAGAKTMPAVMGRDSAGGAASTTAMLFLKNADVIRRKLNLLYSRALTVGCRLMAQDVVVEFKYAELDLRPSSELEAYKSMQQSRILELLSIGFLTDESACIQLTGNLPPDGFTPLSGTMFKAGAKAIASPDSQTSTMNGGKDKLKPETPAAPKGKA